MKSSLLPLLLFVTVFVSTTTVSSFLLQQLHSSSQRRQARRPITTAAAVGCGEDDDDAAADVSSLNAANNNSRGQPPIGLYIHIPFCRRRCRYCDFAIVPIGLKANTDESFNAAAAPPLNTTTIKGAAVAAGGDRSKLSSGFSLMVQNYTDSILKELQRIQQTASDQKIMLRSIYFGGGTPSLAPIDMIRRILQAVTNKDAPFVLDANAEITMEMDPGTFSKEKLQAAKEMGVNRVSLGVQSFDDSILESLGRVHRTKDTWEALATLQEVFGKPDADDGNSSDDAAINYSMDLISGLPGLSLAAWVETLQTAVNLRPKPAHISLYDLQIESGTVFGKWYGEYASSSSNEENADNIASTRASSHHQTSGEAPVSIVRRQLPSEEEAAFMYKYASGYLRSKGYEHYEVSSYALLPETKKRQTASPWRSQHNQIYWDVNGQWYALGLGATSFVDGRLVARPRALADYHIWVDDLQQQQTKLPSTEESSSHLCSKGGEGDCSDGCDKMQDFDFLTDVVLKRLRTSKGLSLNWVRERFPDKGNKYVSAILEGAKLSLDLGLAKLEEEEKLLRLVDPEGFIFSNSIISSIFVELENVEY